MLICCILVQTGANKVSCIFYGREIEHASENIFVLQKLQATAHEEAKRSIGTQFMFDEDEDFGCIPREYVRRKSIRYSLPERIRVNSAYFDAV